MSLIKILLSLVAVIIITVGVFVIYGLNNLDQIIKTTITRIGSQTTQTTVSLTEVSMSLRSGQGRLSGLKIDNPEGFDTQYAFALEHIDIEIDPQSIMAPVVIIRQINIDGAKFIAEEKDYENLNLYNIQQNIVNRRTYVKPTATTDEQTQPRFMIEKMTLSNNSLRLVTEKFGEKQLSLPTISLTNIGDKQTGLTPAELAATIIEPILSQATDTVKLSLGNLAGSHGKNALKKMAKTKLIDFQSR